MQSDHTPPRSTLYPVALAFRRYLTTHRDEDLAAAKNVALDMLEERIVAKLRETMRAYVMAAREQDGECWDEKERMEGGVDALYELARQAGVIEKLIGYDAARERASEAPATIERLEAEPVASRRDLSQEEFLAYAEAQETPKYGPHILRYLDGEHVEEIA